MKNQFDKTFWTNKYANNTTGWDIGNISTPLKNYIDQLKNKNLKILIPGAGNSYEAEYLHSIGFQNVDVIDLVKEPLDNLKKRVPDFPKNNLIQNNFFEHSKVYDLIIEQTFFCALHPDLRITYVKKTNSLLKDKGKVVGLLFNTESTKNEPPFGGNKTEYLQLFSKYFNIKTLEDCYNSIKPRFGTELFFIFEKK